MCNCHYILECCVMFSGVKLSIGSFITLDQSSPTKILLNLGHLGLVLEPLIQGRSA